MLPRNMVRGDGGIGVVEGVAVENIGETLGRYVNPAAPISARWKKEKKLTSRNKSPRIRSMATAQGMGSDVLSFSALRTWRTRVNKSSNPVCSATPSRTLKVLTSATFHHLPFLPPCSSPNGKATSPCSFIPVARLGSALSKARKPREGRM